MTYSVKELFYTLQGEGINAGRPAVFCRFSGCNLWSGLESDRTAAVCKFCDTDFIGTDGHGGGSFKTADDLASAIRATWPGRAEAHEKPLVVCTGGEPLLQLDAAFGLGPAFRRTRDRDRDERDVETAAWYRLDLRQPNAEAKPVLRKGDKLKLIYPQLDSPPDRYSGLDFEHFLLQPMDGPELARNTGLTLRYCLEHPNGNSETVP